MRLKTEQARTQLLVVLLLSTAVSIVLLIGRVYATHSIDYWYMVWNLFLAWLPLGFAWWLLKRLKTKPWRSPGSILLTVLWLGFLPNSFYIASDIIHLAPARHISLLYDVVMLLSFSFNGFLLGFISLYGVHNRLKRRVGGTTAGWLIAAALLLCSFAIYLGRYLRWNSWDVLLNPAGLVFDVSEPFISPATHPQVFTTTLMFFVLLSSIYAVCYRLIKIAKAGVVELDS